MTSTASQTTHGPYEIGAHRELPPEVAERARAWAGAGLFTRPVWMDALAAAYPRFSPEYAVLRDRGEVTGFWPWVRVRQYGFRELLSMPFGSYGGPVLSPHASPEGIRALVRLFREQSRKPRTVRYDLIVREAAPVVRDILIQELGPETLGASTLTVDLREGPEAVWNAYQGRLRTSVRRAEEAGVTGAVETGDAAWSLFYGLYTEQSKTHDVTWHHTRRCLDAVRVHLKHRARVWIARLNGEAVSGQLILGEPGGELVLWLSGSLPEARSVNAFHLLTHRVAEHGAKEGFAAFNLGSSMGKEGVETFKLAFGAKREPLLRFYRQPRWVDLVQKARWS